MSITSGFFDSQNHDRVYEAAEFNRLFDGIITDGVFEHVGNTFTVTPGGGMIVSIDTGRAWFNRTWIYNDALFPVLIPDADNTYSRIDAVIIEVNMNDAIRSGDIRVVTGSPKLNPVRPTLVKADGVYQYALAYITVRANTSQIEESDIENVVNSDETPYVTGQVEQMDVVNLAANWETDFEKHFSDWSRERRLEFDAFLSTVVNELTSTQVGNLQAAILRKEEAPKYRISDNVLPGYSQISVSFDQDDITENSTIDIYASRFGIIAKDVKVYYNLVTISIDPILSYEDIYNFKVVVRNI